MIGLDYLTRAVGDMNVLCRSSPTKGVFAQEAFAVGSCIVVPSTLRVKAMDADNASGVFWKCGGDAPPRLVYELTAMSIAEIPCPAWCMRHNSTKADCNMKIVMRTVNLNVQEPEAGIQRSLVTVPVLQNTKALQEGDELVYYKKASASSSGTKRPFDMV